MTDDEREVRPPDRNDAGEPLSDDTTETGRPREPGPEHQDDEPGPGGASPTPRHTQQGT